MVNIFQNQNHCVVIRLNSKSEMELKKLSEEALNRPPEDVFEIVNQIGKGSYGSVFKSIHKESRQVVAIKKVPFDLQDMLKEIYVMQECDSPHIVKYYGTYFKGSDLWIVMEFCGAGSILDIMKLRGRAAVDGSNRPQVKTFLEVEIATIFRGTLKGLEYLHQNKKIHRDIKAGNILLTFEGNAKLADFGVAAQLNNTIAKRFTSIGTPLWMAPEVIQEIGYDCVADIWSLGITALEMAEGKVPYMEMHPVRAMFKIPDNPPPTFSHPDTWSSEFIEFVSKCLVKSPHQRATASNLLKDDFILKMSKSSEILIPIISEAQQFREALHDSSVNGNDGSQDDLDTTLVEESSNPTIVVSNGCSQNGEVQTTMIEHVTLSTTRGIRHNGMGSQTEKNQVDGISSKIETMVINGEDIDESKSNLRDADETDFCTNSIRNELDNESTLKNKDKSIVSKSSKPLKPKPLSHDICDIERAEQLYMNSNMIHLRNSKTEESIYSNLPLLKQDDDQLQEMFSTKSSSSDLIKEGSFKYIKCLSTDELKAKLQNLDKDMEHEIERITRRYHIKRQPILEGIDEKRKQQHNF